MRQYDVWLGELVKRLAAMPGYGERTTVLVTTDHGCGNGKRWTDHGSDLGEAKRVFAFAVGPHTGSTPERPRYDHRDLRPTVEALLGLADDRRALDGVLHRSAGAGLPTRP